MKKENYCLQKKKIILKNLYKLFRMINLFN